MRRAVASAAMTVMALLSALAQSPPNLPAFEVASVKPSPPPDPAKRMYVGMRGGPGTDDPGRATFQNFTLSNLVNVAFATDPNHVSVSAPNGLGSQMFDIAVKIPDGTTREQFQLMLQNLLVERFHLMFHYQKKEATTYDLVVTKNGPKFRESAEGTSAADAVAPAKPLPPNPGRIGQDGFPILPEGRGRATIMTNGRARARLPEESMDQLAQMLSGPVGSPVANVTGLKGKYDINLYWATDRLRADSPDTESGPTIFDAVQEQLGLKLEPKKGLIDVLVIDHADKVPAEN
jgi:uncharacterized protein (TIGR03435 family)